MTVLSSKTGKFYDVPDDILKKHEVPAERVKEILAELDAEEGGPAGPAGAPTVVIHVSGSGAYVEPADEAEDEGDVEPYGHHHHRRHHGWGGWYAPPPWLLYPRRRRRHHYYY